MNFFKNISLAKIFLLLGKEEYADIECGDDYMVCNHSQKNDRPHLFGVGAPLEISENYNQNITITYNHTYDDAQSVSHNVGIWVWGAYQVGQYLFYFTDEKIVNEYKIRNKIIYLILSYDHF